MPFHVPVSGRLGHLGRSPHAEAHVRSSLVVEVYGDGYRSDDLTYAREDLSLEQLFGYDRTDPTSTIRRYTVDILARYVGENDWETCLEHLSKKADNSGAFTGNEINAEQLKIGETIRIAWNPDRQSTLKYLGNMRFEIVETMNSKWQKGDTFQCQHFILDNRLLVDNLYDANGTLKSKMYVVGENSGLTKLEKV